MYKDIYNGFYRIYDDGRVRANKRIVKSITGNRIYRERFLKPEITNAGYLRVVLSNCGITKKHSIHRLVAESFIPNPRNLPQVNHKNGVKTDNRVENLEWTTASENGKHAYRLGLNSTKYAKKANSIPVTVYYSDTGILFGEFASMSEASIATNCPISTISNRCHNKIKSKIRKYTTFTFSFNSQTTIENTDNNNNNNTSGSE